MTNSIVQIIKSKCPNVVAIIGNKLKFWSSVESVYMERLEFIKKSIAEGNYIKLRKSLIDDMILFRKERTKLNAFLNDIDLKAKTIYESVLNDRKKVDKLRYILEQLILPEKVEPKSYDRIAEIYAIDYLLSRNHLELKDLEYNLTNGRQIDCLFQNTNTQEYILIDFVSINVDTDKVESAEKFAKFLANKLLNKYLYKTADLRTPHYPIRLLPVLWLEEKIFKEYFDLLVASETALNTEFFMLRGIHNVTDKKYQTIFGTISDFKYLS